MNEKRQNFLIAIGIFVLVGLIGGIAYSFFNYTRNGAVNTLRLGDIEFNFTQGNSINLTNAFPVTITRDGNGLITNNDTDNIGTVEVVITGKNTYSEGVEYLVSSTNSVTTITSNGKPVQVPISLDVQVGTNGNGANDNLGTADASYFTNRDSYTTSHYKKLVGDTLVGDQMMLVGYIAPDATNTDNSINGKITIKAYFDASKMMITDTPDETNVGNKTYMSTSEWNSLNSSGVSFQVKVEANEGIWVKGSLSDIMASESLGVDTEQGVDFSKTSDWDNTRGVYLRAGTQNVSGSYPVYYYRGAVENNNVVFNNICWKAVRTTDTGGVKLIYNGETGPVYEKVFLSLDKYNVQTNTDGTNTGVWTFNSTDNSWNANHVSGSLELSFKVPAGDTYIFQLSGTFTSSGGGSWSVFKDNGSSLGDYGGSGGTNINWSYTYGTLTADNIVKFTYSGSASSEDPTILKIQMIGKGDLLTSNGCDNTGTASQITLNSTNTFAFSGTNPNLSNSPAYVGYMWGDVYTYNTTGWISGAKFGSGFTSDGTNYKLTNATETEPNATHHYSCNNPDANATCTELRYVYYVNGTTQYYITLTGGDGIEEAIEKMQRNTNPSNAKTQIDAWYLANMTSYTGKLEDTIWCNDRSIGRYNGWSETGAWGSDYKESSLLYGAHERSNYASGTSTVKNQPSLGCVNKNDAFTVSSQKGNQKLTYPVAMLTEDEIVLAGGLAGSSSGFYLNTGQFYWSLSPYSFHYKGYVNEFRVASSGLLPYGSVSSTNGLRPSVSLKPGTPVVSGDGTSASPYLIS